MANTPSLMDLQKHVITGVLLGLLLLYDHHHGCVASAASGGRMGGRSLYSSSSSESNSPTPRGNLFFVERERQSSDADGGWLRLFVWLFLALVLHRIVTCITAEKTSVVKLQVGFSGNVRSLQKELNRIAQTADTSKPDGLTYILQETAIALLRQTPNSISAYSSVDMKRSIEEGEKILNQLYIEERLKFDVGAPVNVNNIIKPPATTQRSNDGRDEYIVITIIVAVKGVYKLRRMNSRVQLKEALHELATISSKRVKAVEVLWTPQSENDTLTKREFLDDYQQLRSLCVSPQD